MSLSKLSNKLAQRIFHCIPLYMILIILKKVSVHQQLPQFNLRNSFPNEWNGYYHFASLACMGKFCQDSLFDRNR